MWKTLLDSSAVNFCSRQLSRSRSPAPWKPRGPERDEGAVSPRHIPLWLKMLGLPDFLLLFPLAGALLTACPQSLRAETGSGVATRQDTVAHIVSTSPVVPCVSARLQSFIMILSF